MTVERIVELVQGRIVCGEPTHEVRYAFAADLMSDVLTLTQVDVLFITGLVAPQTIRTAAISDIGTILVVRGKTIPQGIVELAAESDIALIVSPFSMYRASGELYRAGLEPIF